MITTKGSHDTLARIAELMQLGPRMYYLRHGGDFAMMMGHNDMMHHHSPALAKEILESVQIDHPECIHSIPICAPDEPGMERIGISGQNPPKGPYIGMMNKIEETMVQREFYQANAMTYLAACDPACLRAFLDQHVVRAPKVFLGSLQQEHMEKLFGPIKHHVLIPPWDAYYSMDEWWPLFSGKCLDPEVTLILIAAGLAGRVVEKRLWYAGVHKHILDIGSWTDAFVGNQTRSWIRTAYANNAFQADKLLYQPVD
jgi:hypothetical protein